MQRLLIARLNILFPLLTLILTALHLYVWTLPRTPTPIPEPGMPEAVWWGLWPVTYLPGWIMGIGAGVILLTLVVSLRKSAWERHASQAKGGRWGNLIGGLIIGGFVILFYAFPIVHTRWGDAYILTKAIALDDPTLRLTHSWQAPLDLFLHSQLWLTFHERFGWEDAMPVYRLLSPLAGLLYLLGAANISRRLSPLPVWLPFSLLTSIGVMQLFFGYIENYSFAAAGILLYLWLGLAVLEGRRPLWQATLALAVTNAFHPSTLVYGLSLLYLGRRVFRDEIRNTQQISRFTLYVLRFTHLALPMLLVGSGTILLMELGDHGIATLLTTDRPGGGDARWLVPLWETTTRWEQYTLFSWPHLCDLLNQQLLVAPVVLPGVISLFVIGHRSFTIHNSQFAIRHSQLILAHIGLRVKLQKFSERNAPISPLRPNEPSQFIFLALAAACHLLLTWLWNPDYGGQRDWDLFSLAAIPLTVLFAYQLAVVYTRASSQPPPQPPSQLSAQGEPTHQPAAETSTQRMVMAVIIPPLVLQYLHTAAWIYQNTLPWEWP